MILARGGRVRPAVCRWLSWAALTDLSLARRPSDAELLLLASLVKFFLSLVKYQVGSLNTAGLLLPTYLVLVSELIPRRLAGLK